MLRGRRLGGFQRREHMMVGTRPDFLCPEVGLIVEVDGHTHEPEEDALRDANLLALGFTTVRFSNTDVMENLEGVCLHILQTANHLPPRVWGGGAVW